ncbi:MULTISPECIES: HoxN/HupN/NixA family nickel/cobalt transporter [Legionella]|uniref:Nickel/cobalt efflux system n=1 Tax=Legionella drozanskii LLAP-1 TaxID=1212489 RepID=A0A0W0SMY3_9GAMM|nr:MULTISPECIES: HoxN/HupN/NixA family nickel/cobalt transporter [Legionella]KTC84778.1 high affinity nickel transport protein [Legionella drozanskii LLAP-1]PJE06625.1 MAG: HoxN/HupN/NixA family nickel/cobalt transporter [Legionella sp.]
MLTYLQQSICYLFNDSAGDLRKKSILLYIILFIYTALVWMWAFYTLHDKPFLFSTAVLAYTFGLRHAVDADHIAAIDNVTRKLMQEGKEPISLGFFFSLGHSTVVMIATIGVALITSAALHSHLSAWHRTANIICTSISASFLLIIAIINLFIFFSIWRTFKEVRRSKYYCEEDIDEIISNSGFLARYFRTFFRLITKSWQMYFLGFLFGIGFDTATEIALLGIAASQATQGFSPLTILVFPALFTAGMTLIDTTDCIIMLGAYGWAFMKPIRKLYYNLTITFISCVVALFIGGIEALGLIADHFGAQGFIWDGVRTLTENMNYLGYFIILLFIFCWGVSISLYNYLKVEAIIEK